MKNIKLGFIVLITSATIMSNSDILRGQEKTLDKSVGISKETYVPQTEYEKKLEEFSKPKMQLFNNGNEKQEQELTTEQLRILSEMKLRESQRILAEDSEAKQVDAANLADIVGILDEAGTVSQFNNRNWSFYFPQKWGAYGDAFVTNKNQVFKKQKGLVGHAALGGYDRSATLEAAFGRTLGWESDRWFTPDDRNVDSWTPGTHLYYAIPANGTWAELGVRNASLAQYRRAHDYGDARTGWPYNISFREDGNGLYCSELVALAWRSAGVDIIPQKKDWNYIWPMDIYESSKTFRIRGVIH